MRPDASHHDPSSSARFAEPAAFDFAGAAVDVGEPPPFVVGVMELLVLVVLLDPLTPLVVVGLVEVIGLLELLMLLMLLMLLPLEPGVVDMAGVVMAGVLAAAGLPVPDGFDPPPVAEGFTPPAPAWKQRTGVGWAQHELRTDWPRSVHCAQTYDAQPDQGENEIL